MTAVYPQEFAPETRRERLLHAAGLLAIVFVVLPVSLAEQAARAQLDRLGRGDR